MIHWCFYESYTCKAERNMLHLVLWESYNFIFLRVFVSHNCLASSTLFFITLPLLKTHIWLHDFSMLRSSFVFLVKNVVRKCIFCSLIDTDSSHNLWNYSFFVLYEVILFRKFSAVQLSSLRFFLIFTIVQHIYIYLLP